jgi:spermidine synthase
MVLQILGTRIIGPHFGVGLYVWTALITVTLVALAVGYWAGGVVADRHPTRTGLASVLLAAAAAVALIPLVRGPAIDLGWMLGVRAGGLLASTVLFLPSLLLLGMVSPYAIRLETESITGAGRTAGRLYAISTLGSVTGATLAGFVLVPSFRVPTLLASVAVTLAVAAVLAAAPGFDRRVAAAAAAITAVAAALAWPRPMPPALLAAATAESTALRVVAHDDSRFLMADQVVQSSVDQQGRSRDKYVYFLAARVLLARPATRRALVVGLGGGGIVSLLADRGIEVDGVDLSPEVIRFARDHFGLALPPERIHAEDGRVFLRRHPGRFDVVVLDAFSGDHVAATLVSREGLAIAKAAMIPGGLLALNTWGIDEAETGPNLVGAAIRRTLEQEFAHVLAVPAAGNLLLFASDDEIAPARDAVELQAFDGPRTFRWLAVPEVSWPDAPVLTDDWNPVDVLNTAGIDASRASRRGTFPDDVRQALDWE